MTPRPTKFAARAAILALASLLFAAPILRAQQTPTRADAERDPVLKAMLVELDRNQKRLELPGSAKPYFIEFRIDDVVEYSAHASFGALTRENEIHSRVARVRVRVGDYKFDNSHARVENQMAALLQRLGGDGMMAIEVTDDDPIGLRYNLWNAADMAYKQALDDLAAKQAELKTVSTPPQANSFAEEKPVVSLEPPLTLQLDRGTWKRAIADASGLPLNDPAAKAFASEVEESTGELTARVRTEYLVNTEGSIVRKSYAEYRAESAYRAQASDGMRLERTAAMNGSSAAGLGTPDRFRDSSLRSLTSLDALCKAPVVAADEYQGPVLLGGNAAARSMDELLARAVEARAPALGSTARTTGAFASSYQTRVLPDFLSVTDDPGLATFSGREIVGAYKVDDEGVPAQKVSLVENGRLIGYLLSREPIRDFAQSNGHGRAATGQAPQSRLGVLKVDAASPISDDDLVKKLIAMGKDQGLEFVYRVDVLSGTQTRTLYRIKVADGTSELVRGGELGELNLHTFRSGIVAAGDKPFIYNISGDVPTTVIAPALLLDDLTVKRAQERDNRLPFYPPPPAVE